MTLTFDLFKTKIRKPIIPVLENVQLIWGFRAFCFRVVGSRTVYETDGLAQRVIGRLENDHTIMTY